MPIESKIKVDAGGECIRVDNITGVVTVDGAPVFKVRLEPSGKVYLQFWDRNKYRIAYRGGKLIEVPMEAIIDKIRAACV